MDERQKRVFHAYDKFIRFGILDASEVDPVDFGAVQQALRLEVDAFEVDIHDAYLDNQSQQAVNLTRVALLGMVINGDSDEQLQTYIEEKKLSKRLTLEARVNEILLQIPKIHKKAERSRHSHNLESKIPADDISYRSLDDTLVKILSRNGMRESEQGSMRVLFGLVVVSEDQNQADVIMQIKSNAAGVLRQKLNGIQKELASSPRMKEGERLILQITNRARSDYLTVESLAEIITNDMESRRKSAYTNDYDHNKRLIETYISDVFDVMYPDPNANV